jgi:hypothetical protein
MSTLLFNLPSGWILIAADVADKVMKLINSASE